MTLPLIGPLTMSGFVHPWAFLLLVIPVAVAVRYLAVQRAGRVRVLRFANLELLDGVAPRRGNRWRHLPAVLLASTMVVLIVGWAGPTGEVRVARNRAVVVLVIDVSPSMLATDVAPSRLRAAREAAQHFAAELTPGINLGLVAFGGSAMVLVAPTPDHAATATALDRLQTVEGTAIGDAIAKALQVVGTVGAVIGGGDGPPPARIVLLSDGMENRPAKPDAPTGAFTAARTAKDAGVPISAISFGTSHGTIEYDHSDVAVPVADGTLARVAQLSGGTLFHAADGNQLADVYAALRDQIGYQTVRAEASAGWFRLGSALLLASVVTALFARRAIPL